MKHLFLKISAIFILWIALLLFLVPWNSYNISLIPTFGEYRLGLDLQGWIELDYTVDLAEAELDPDYSPAKETQIIEGLKSIIDKRVETLNINDSVITTASYGGEQHIIVQIPLKWNDSLENNENIERAKAAIGKFVKIEFRERKTQITETDIQERKNIAQSALDEVALWNFSFQTLADKYSLSHENIQTGEVDDFTSLFEGTIIPNKLNEVSSVFGGNGYLITQDTAYIYVSEQPSDWKPAVDSQGRVLNDKYFTNSSVQFNEAFQPMVELVFNDEWAEIFGELTTRLINQQIAIFVGWELLTAPNVNEAIYSGKAVITGSYTADEARELSQNINTWVVPAPIYLTSEQTIDSKLGAESLEKLILAWISGFILILIFLIIVYRWAGCVAALALFLYVMMILSIVKIFGIVLTLASIAGLILSIGIAIDANILIFERIRDEIKKWNTLSDATKNGFSQSWTAIWDSNLTGFIVAMILFIFGINIIKWFWLMLWLGIMVSLLSCYWISRVLLREISWHISNSRSFIGK